MDPESNVAGGGDDAAAMGLDDALGAALADLDKSASSKGDEGTGAAATSSSASTTTDDAAGKGGKSATDGGESAAAGKGDDAGRARGPDGKFVSKDAAAAAGGAPAGDAAAQAAAAAAKTGQDAAQQTAGATDAAAAAQPELVDGRDITKAPNSWKPEAAAEFGKLPPAVRAEIHRREEAMFKGIENYKGAAQFGTELAKQFHPYSQMLKAIQMAPGDVVHAALQFEYGIRTAKTPEAKLEIITNLAKTYGVTLPGAAGAGDGKGGAGAQVDPTIAALQTEVRELKGKLTAREQTEAQERQQQEQADADDVRKEIAAFAADPKNEFYGLVKSEMLKEIQFGRASDLKTAYDNACKLHPVVSETLIARRLEAKQKQDAEKAAAANKANVVNVTPRATPQGKTAGKGTLDDALKSSLDEVMARSA